MLEAFSDLELIDGLRNKLRAEACFEVLVRRYQKPLYAQAYQILQNHNDSADCLQNAFIQIWQHIGDYRGDAALFSWMYRIVRNEALQILRKRREMTGLGCVQINAESHPLKSGQEILDNLHAAVSTLPTRQQEVFIARYFHDTPYQDLAVQTGLSVGALKASYHHAAQKVEAFMKQSLNIF